MCWRLFNDHNIFVNLLQIINLWIQFLFIWRFLLDSMHDELLFELFVRFLQLFTDSTKLWFRIKLNFWIHMCRVLCACSSAGVMGCIPVQWNILWWPATSLVRWELNILEPVVACDMWRLWCGMEHLRRLLLRCILSYVIVYVLFVLVSWYSSW